MGSLPLTFLSRDIMSLACLARCLLAFLTQLTVARSGPESVPIGAVFDANPGEMASALKWQIHQHNSNKATSFNLRENIQPMPGRADGFSISTAICNEMKKGTFALLGTHNANTINTIKSFSSTFHMPYITPSMPFNISGQQNNYEIYMQPLYSKALIEFMDSVGWRKVYYVYLLEEGLRRLEQLFDCMAKEDIHIEVEVKRVTSVNDAVDALARLDMRTEDMDKRIILDLPTSETNKFFAALERKALRKVRFHYLLAGLDINMLNLEKFKHGGINITGYRIVDYHNQTVVRWINSGWSMLHKETWPGGGVKKISFQQAMIADGVRALIKALLELVVHQPNVFKSTLHTKNYYFYNNGSEGINCDIGGAGNVIPWEHGYKILKEIKKVEFCGLTGKVSFDEFGLRKDFTLDLLEVTVNRGLAKIGWWHPRSGLNKGKASLIRSKVGSGPSNQTRIVTSILTAPYLMVKTPLPNQQILDENPNEKYEGYCADIAKKIAEKVSFDYIIRPVKDGKYGAQDENGTWNGMVGELVRNTDPYLSERNVSDTGEMLEGNDRYVGFCADLTRKVAQLVKFDYIIRPVRDGKYGEPDENGTWNGIVGELVRNVSHWRVDSGWGGSNWCLVCAAVAVAFL